jgi:hypothetical protein
MTFALPAAVPVLAALPMTTLVAYLAGHRDFSQPHELVAVYMAPTPRNSNESKTRPRRRCS